MAVFRVERNKGYTVMSNHHLRNKELSLKAKGLLSQMLSLPEDWDYTLKGLSLINREKIDAIREAIRELERTGYIVRSRERDEKAATSWGRFYRRLFQCRAELPPDRFTYRHCGGGHCPADYLCQGQEREEVPKRHGIRLCPLGDSRGHKAVHRPGI